MLCEYHLRGVEGSDHTIRFIKKYTDQIVKKLLKHTDYHLNVWVGGQATGQHRQKYYDCEASVQSTDRTKSLIIKKRDTSFYRAVKKTGFALNKALRRRNTNHLGA
jgi:hypothetical protein